MTRKSSPLTEAENGLVELYQTLAKSRAPWDQPFLAGRGEHYQSSDPKILIVGKATGGWCDVPNPRDPDSIRGHSDEIMNSGGLDSAFWRYIQLLAQETSPGWKEPFKHLAWTNIARLGYRGKNPNASQFKEQEAVCNKLLRAEISDLRPDLIVLVTHDFQHKFVKNFFLGVDWQNLSEGNRYARSGILDNHAAIVWTRHPQGRPGDESRRERQAILDFFSKWRARNVTSK